MAGWTADELTRIGDAEELEISSHRPDGSLRPFITIWAVRVGDDVFVRSAYGSANGWYRRALASGSGRISAGGVEHEVTFVEAETDADVQAAVDAEYRSKYAHYPSIVGGIVGEKVHDVTLQLVP